MLVLNLALWLITLMPGELQKSLKAPLELLQRDAEQKCPGIWGQATYINRASHKLGESSPASVGARSHREEIQTEIFGGPPLVIGLNAQTSLTVQRGISMIRVIQMIARSRNAYPIVLAPGK